MPNRLQGFFHKRTFFLALGVISLFVGAAFGVWKTAQFRQQENTATGLPPSASSATSPLSNEEIADLTMPALVRVYHRITGEAKIPSFTVKLAKREIALNTKNMQTVPIDYEFSGNGFFVHPSGYIAASAYAVSLRTAERAKIHELIFLETGKALLLEAKKSKTAPKTGTSTAARQTEIANEIFAKEFARAKKASTFTLESAITVLNQSDSADTLASRKETGFEAERLAADDEYADTGKNAAIIKISRERLPSIPLAQDSELPTGRTVLMFEIPSAGDPNARPPEQTLASGIIAGRDNSPNDDFKFYRISVNVSPNSVGAPVIDINGAVQGIIASLSADEKGNTIAYAIPAPVLADTVRTIPIDIKVGAYYANLYEGIQSLHQKRCSDALLKFESARTGTNGAFLPAKTLEKYVEECNRIIAAGESIDSKSEWMKYLNDVFGPLIWYLVGVLIFGICAVSGFVIFLKRRKRKQERAAEKTSGEPAAGDLAEKIEQTPAVEPITRAEFAQKRQPAYTAFLTKREEKKKEVAHSEAELAAIGYIKTQQKAGFADDEIARALKIAGWQEDAVRKLMLFAKVE